MPSPRGRGRPDAPRPAQHPLERLVARIDAAGDSAGAAPGSTLPPDGSVPSGFPSLDRVLGGGLRPQDLVVLGGDVGSGKSALALAMAIRAARAGIPTVFLSGELAPDRTLERALALEARVDVDTLRGGAPDELQRAAVGGAAVALRDLPLTVRALLGDRDDEVESALDALPRPRLAIVDSLQLVTPPHASARTEERTAQAVRHLKAIALRREVALVATAQLPNLEPGRADPRPTLADHGGRGAVKQVADVVLGLYREEMYRQRNGVEGATELLISKQRNGPVGFIDLYFYPRFLRFEDMIEPGHPARPKA